MTVLIPTRFHGYGRVRQSNTSRALKGAVYVVGFGIGAVIGVSLFSHRVAPAPSVATRSVAAPNSGHPVQQVAISRSATHPMTTPTRERTVPQLFVARSAAGPGVRTSDQGAGRPLAPASRAGGAAASVTGRAAAANNRGGAPSSAVPRNQRVAMVHVPPSKPAAAEDWTNRLAGYRVQVGVFTVRQYAQELIQRLHTHSYHATVVDGAAGPPYRVWIVGALNTLGAEHLANQLRKDRFDAVVVKIEARVF